MHNYPGNLDWITVAERPDLVAPPVAEALADFARTGSGPAGCRVAAIDPELADTAAFCERYAVSPAQSANCVVVEGRRGDQVSMAACMVLATDRADINKTVRKHLGVRKISFADMATATGLTGMEYGGITPIGLPADWPVLVDARVVRAGVVVVGSGLRTGKIAVDGVELLKLPGAEELALAQGQEPSQA